MTLRFSTFMQPVPEIRVPPSTEVSKPKGDAAPRVAETPKIVKVKKEKRKIVEIVQFAYRASSPVSEHPTSIESSLRDEVLQAARGEEEHTLAHPDMLEVDPADRSKAGTNNR
eukprot:4875693-Pyramimonas_sp.AAC.1